MDNKESRPMNDELLDKVAGGRLDMPAGLSPECPKCSAIEGRGYKIVYAGCVLGRHHFQCGCGNCWSVEA